MSSFDNIERPFTYQRQTGWWYVQFCKLSQLLTPTFLRNARMKAWTCLLVFPIQQLYNRWANNRRENLYTLEHNSQVCYLRKVLNDRFDAKLRRIIITDGQSLDQLYIYTEGEEKPLFLHGESEGQTPVFLHPAAAYAGGADFYVIVPFDLNYNELAMRALVDFYRLASKRYEIIAA